MKRGLVLEGGGAKGAFHCGAVMALYDNGYTFDGVAGTSIGAINAALIAQDCNYDSLLRMWEHVTASMFTDFDDTEVENILNKKIDKSTLAYWSKQAIKIIKNLGVPTDKVIPFLKKHISEERVRNSKMELALVTYSLTDRAPVEIFCDDIPQGELHDYVFASAYYPAFKLNKLNGKYYIDGGVYDNMPISLLAKRGYDEIFAVRTMSKMPYKADCGDKVKVNFICPSEDLGGTTEISHKMVNRNIKLGYYDALRFLKGYSGFRFYLIGDTKPFEEKFNAIIVDKYIEIAKILKISSDATPDMVFSKTYSFLNKTYSNSKRDFSSIIKFMEDYALNMGMEKFKIYNIDDFFKKIIDKSKDFNIVESNRLNIFSRDKIKKDMLFKVLTEAFNE